MKNQTSNGRVSHFDAIKPTYEEEVPQDLNEGKLAESSMTRRKTYTRIRVKRKDLMLKCKIK